MEWMDDVWSEIQCFLMRKDTECGELIFLTSRATTESGAHVEDVCKTIGDILRRFNIPIKEESSKNDKRCVQTFKYLVANTGLQCQENLAEDSENGHLVDMCPSLSLYLLIEILWSLRYEEIVAESLLYMPLDVSVDVLTISRRSITLLDFERSLEFVTTAALNCYKKMIIISERGVQSICFRENLACLTFNCQELIALLSDPEFQRVNQATSLKKSERYGLILKRIIELMKNCIKIRREGVELSPEMESMYRFTFGRREVVKSEGDLANDPSMVAQEIGDLLVEKLKEIDCNTYLDWASIETEGDDSISMQQSIGYDCYYLVELIKDTTTEPIVQYDNLIPFLKHFSCEPKVKVSLSKMDLRDLRDEAAATGKAECLKELLKRYRKWTDNHETFQIIERNKSLLDKDDFYKLLSYLVHLRKNSDDGDYKQRVYTTITKILPQLDIGDMYYVAVNWIVSHGVGGTLESGLTVEAFIKFMAKNKDFRIRRNLRILLFFLLKSPLKLLTIVVKIAIGDPEFRNSIISPRDLKRLSPLMIIRDSETTSVILTSLSSVCIDNVEWDAKKFALFVQTMLDSRIFTADEMVNYVFIPYLRNADLCRLSNLGCVLNCLRKFFSLCTKETRVMDLLEALAKRMSRLRNDVNASKYSTSETLDLISRVIDIFLCQSEIQVDAQVAKFEFALEPLDKYHLSSLFASYLLPKFGITYAIKEYERKCFFVMNRVTSQGYKVDDEANLANFHRFEDHFFRHCFVRATEIEYVRFAFEATLLCWSSFGWNDQYEAFDKIVKITFEACVYCLEFPTFNSINAFPCLLKHLTKFARFITSIEEIWNEDSLYKCLVHEVRALHKYVRKTSFAPFFPPIILLINNRANHEPVSQSIRLLVESIDDFVNRCLQIPHNEVKYHRSHSYEAATYRIAYNFVNQCFLVNHDESNYSSLLKMYRFLTTRIPFL